MAPQRTTNLPPPRPLTVSSTNHSSTLPPPIFRSVTAPKRGASLTAHLEHILGVIHKRWGAEYTLVTSDGIELEDSPATQGKN